MISRMCLFCKKKFDFRACPTDVNTSRGKFCSNLCKSEYRRKLPKEYKCQKCGKIVPNLWGKRRTFCSISCSKKGKPSPLKGIPLPKEIREKISKAKYEYYKNGGISWLKGTHGLLKIKRKTRIKISAQKQGIKEEDWKGFKTAKMWRIRVSKKYKHWRNLVLKRDKWRCVFCGIKQGWDKELKKKTALHADHIKPFALFPELHFELSNGRTLCVDCHKKTPTWGFNSKYYGKPIRTN